MIDSLFQTPIKNCYGIIPKVFKDHRGEFYESYNEHEYPDLALLNWCQDNISISHRNVFRGLHFQTGEYAQNKLITVIKGSILDVVVDCRVKSRTFGSVIKIELSSVNKKQLFVPAGCAHGFLSLEDGTIVSYKCDMPYNPSAEGGICPLDFKLNIWDDKYDPMMFNLSEKDKNLPSWKNCYKFGQS